MGNSLIPLPASLTKYILIIIIIFTSKCFSSVYSDTYYLEMHFNANTLSLFLGLTK